MNHSTPPQTKAIVVRHSINTLVFLGLTLSLIALFSSNAQAAVESESNDSFATADAWAAGSNTGVIGDLSSVSNDVDIWQFNLTSGAGMAASISDGPGTDFNGFDPIMVLFMEDGGNYYPVAGSNPNLFQTNFSFTPWLSGTYYLAITAFGNSPQDQFNNQQYDSVYWSDNFFGLGTPFHHFESNSFSSFDYDLALSGTVGAVPVPAAAWLFITGIAGLVGLARRKA